MSLSSARPRLAKKEGLEEEKTVKNEGWARSQRAGWHLAGVCLKEVRSSEDRLKTLNVRRSRDCPADLLHSLWRNTQDDSGSQHSALEHDHRPDKTTDHASDATYFMRTNLQNRTWIFHAFARLSRVYGFYTLVIRAEIKGFCCVNESSFTFSTPERQDIYMH